MSLTWSLSGINNYQEVCFEPDPTQPGKTIMCDKTNTIIWYTMITGIGDIKNEKEAEEYYRRYRMFKFVTVPAVNDYFELDDVKRHIGLKTNVLRESSAKFNAKLIRWAQDRFEREERQRKSA